ncbi:MAG: hypothetical protein DRJ05_08655 [Bacteroidetes bacterium]|nr:MAG: hypothetical protein DRJ05_08655 [Bacteroidota bacterium]
MEMLTARIYYFGIKLQAKGNKYQIDLLTLQQNKKHVTNQCYYVIAYHIFTYSLFSRKVRKVF